MNLKELIESLNLGEDVDATKIADDMTKAIEESVTEKLELARTELQNEYDLKLAESLVDLQAKAEAQAEEKLAESVKELEEYHQAILAEEIEAVQNELKVAADVRSVRGGLQKIMEGLAEAGFEVSQLWESAVAANVAELEERLALTEAALEMQEVETKRFQRAFIVSESTRGLTDVARDAVVKSADSLDESIEAARFHELVQILVADKPLAEATAKKVTEDDDDMDDDDDGDKDADASDNAKDDDKEDLGEKKKKALKESQHKQALEAIRETHSRLNRYFK